MSEPCVMRCEILRDPSSPALPAGGRPEPHFQSYTVPYREDWVVLDALNHIKDHLDATLSYRWSCHMAICGSCGMMINGEPKLACHAFLRDYRHGMIRIEPLDHFPIERDLVIVMDSFMEKLSSVKPYLIAEEKGRSATAKYLQTPAAAEGFKQYTLCINCLLCYAACPQCGAKPGLRRPGGAGAGAPLQSRFPRRRQRRTGRRGGQQRGHLECTFVGACSEVCPKHVDPAAAIQQTKTKKRPRFFPALCRPPGGIRGPVHRREAHREHRPPLYLRPPEPLWWAHSPYRAYTLREATGVAVAGYAFDSASWPHQPRERRARL